MFYLASQPHLPDVFPSLSPLHLPHPRLKSFPLSLAENSSGSQVKELNRLTRVGKGRKNKTRREASPPSLQEHGFGLCNKSPTRPCLTLGHPAELGDPGLGKTGIPCAGEVGATLWDARKVGATLQSLGNGEKELGRSSDLARVTTFWAFPAGGWVGAWP